MWPPSATKEMRSVFPDRLLDGDGHAEFAGR